MLLYPPCKINIGLHILRKRSDGFHDLELSFFEISSLTDILEITPAEDYSLTLHGIPVDGKEEDNLVIKARKLMEENCGKKLPCHIHLYKNIPMGSGLGGGSADATYTLMGLNHLFHLGLTQKDIQELASHLGSDCAFFSQNKSCIGHGRGNLLSPLSGSLQIRVPVLIAVPSQVAISTAEAYRGCIPTDNRPSLSDLLCQGITTWKNLIQNDFEKTLFPIFPILQEIKETLYANGAAYASLSGSGSALFGIFLHGIPEDISIKLPHGCFLHQTEIDLPVG